MTFMTELESLMESIIDTTIFLEKTFSLDLFLISLGAQDLFEKIKLENDEYLNLSKKEYDATPLKIVCTLFLNENTEENTQQK